MGVSAREAGLLEVAAAAAPGQTRSGPEAAAYAVDGLIPALAVEPPDVEQVQAVIRAAAAHNLAVCPIGGGVHLRLGLPPARYDVALSLRALSRRVEHQPAELVVTAEAGVRLADLQRALAAHRQWLPVDPPRTPGTPGDEGGPTVGGIVAAHVDGPCRLRYGLLREHLIGLRAVLADGSLVRSGGRVVKNVAGYDLCRLFAGSLGTLGVIVEATFRVQPVPEARRTLAAHAPSLDGLTEALDRLADSELSPAFAELASPGAWERSGHRNGWTLITAFDGPAETVAWEVQRAREIAARCDMAVEELPPAEARGVHDRVFGAPFADREAVVCRLSVLGSRLLDLLPDLDPRWLACAHALSGVLRVALPGGTVAEAEVARLRGRVHALGGTLVVEAAPPEMKASLDVWGPLGPELRLMRAVKQQLDPQGIMSPGRSVGGL